MFYFYNDTSKPAPFVRDESEPKLETIRVCKKYDRSIGLVKQSVIPRCGDCWSEFGE